jgi:hypothetical protein
MLIVLLFLSAPARGLFAQSQPASDPNLTSTQFDMTGFPQWSKDLRRGEIIAFGSFPFVYFFTNFFFDAYRTASHGWDRRYAPWPMKPAGAIGKTQGEEFLTLGAAAGGAVIIAVVDHLIVRYRRGKLEEETRNLPAGTPIITRRPLFAEEAVPPETFPSEQGPAEAVPSGEAGGP